MLLIFLKQLLKPPHRFLNRFLLKPVMVSRKTAAINNAETMIYNGLYSDYENSNWTCHSKFHVMKKIKIMKANLINLIQSAMELLQIATAKFIIKCDGLLFCYKVRQSLKQIATYVTKCAIIITNCDNTEKPSCSACLTVRQSLFSILKGIDEILYPIKWRILKRTAT